MSKTIPGGLFLDSAGRPVNCNGQPVPISVLVAAVETVEDRRDPIGVLLRGLPDEIKQEIDDYEPEAAGAEMATQQLLALAGVDEDTLLTYPPEVQVAIRSMKDAMDTAEGDTADEDDEPPGDEDPPKTTSKTTTKKTTSKK